MSQRRGGTTEQLRDEIDRGRTGDKVDAIDPAAAPLGTDEEAAGTPIDPKLLAIVRRRERSMHPKPAGHQSTDNEDWSGVVIWLVVVIGLVIGVAAGLVLA
jgi:hypothetical protein